MHLQDSPEHLKAQTLVQESDATLVPIFCYTQLSVSWRWHGQDFLSQTVHRLIACKVQPINGLWTKGVLLNPTCPWSSKPLHGLLTNIEKKINC